MSARVTTTGAPRTADQRRINRTCVSATHDGRRVLRTPAVGTTEARWYEAQGFTIVQHLVVLRRDLTETASLLHRSPTPDVEISTHSVARRRARTGDRDRCASLADLDATGFGTDWRLTIDALLHACRSTPIHCVFIAQPSGIDNEMPIGYAIAGVAYETAYLQRLVVAPEHRDRRIATALVAASMAWARSKFARHLLVNTEPHNTAALALYRSLDFTTDVDGLVVLERDEQPAT